jgi:hypothetical protein
MAMIDEMQTPKATGAETSLFESITKLFEVTSALESVVFGEKPKDQSPVAQQPVSRVVSARDAINEATNRLGKIFQGLELLR